MTAACTERSTRVLSIASSDRGGRAGIQARLYLRAARVPTRNVHGTGCTLSSAIAAQLALGHALPQAVALGRDYVARALAADARVQTGQGQGPLDHGRAPVATRHRPL